jgi:glutaredoxin
MLAPFSGSGARGVSARQLVLRAVTLQASLLLGVLGMANDASAQVYRWVDNNGGVHYTQQPPPKGAAKSVEQRKLRGSVIETSQAPFALKQAMARYPVTLFVAPNCKAGCPEARDLLTRRGVPYREVDVVDAATDEALRKATGDNQLPSLLVGSVVQVGYNADAFQRVLDSAGYPEKPAFVGKAPELPPLPERKPPAGERAGSDTPGAEQR